MENLGLNTDFELMENGEKVQLRLQFWSWRRRRKKRRRRGIRRNPLMKIEEMDGELLDDFMFGFRLRIKL